MFDFYDCLGMITTALWGDRKIEQEEFYLKTHPEKKFHYRPQTLSDYISQENAKVLIRLLIREVKEVGKFRHILLSGCRGHGKTTLAYIICRELGFEPNYYIANSFRVNNLQDFLYKVTDKKIPQVLILDETHGLNKELIEMFYPLLEDGVVPNTSLKLNSFIVIGATTELEYLQKKYPPFVDRHVNIELLPYKSEEIKLLLDKYNQEVYQQYITEEDLILLADNSRMNPRTAILLFDLFVTCGKVDEVLKCNGIIKNGLTYKDIVVLEHLAEINKPVGIEALAVIAHTDSASFKELTEPYLLQQGYLTRTARGRLITNKGMELLNNLE